MTNLDILTTAQIIAIPRYGKKNFHSKGERYVEINSLIEYLEKEHYANAIQKYCVTCKLLRKLRGQNEF